MDGEETMHKSQVPDMMPPFIKVKWPSGAEDIHYSFLSDGIPEPLRHRYEIELDETPEKRENGLSRLKEIIRLENLDNLDDNVLLAILRASKFNLQKSESKLKKFVVHRRNLLKKLAMIDMDVVKIICESTCYGFLPFRDKHGRSIIYSRPCGFEFDKYSGEEATVVCIAMVLFSFSMELSTSAGLIHIKECTVPSADFNLFTLNIFRKFTTSFLSLPVMLKKVEVLNASAPARGIYRLIRPLFPEKIVKRINFRGPHESLTQSYHPDILPKEFGGHMGHVSKEFFKNQLLDFIAELREEAKSF